MGTIGTVSVIFSTIRETVMKDYAIKRVLSDTTNVDLDPTPGSRTLFEISCKISKEDTQGNTKISTLKGYVRNGSQQTLQDTNWGIDETGYVRNLTISYLSGGHRSLVILWERSL